MKYFQHMLALLVLLLFNSYAIGQKIKSANQSLKAKDSTEVINEKDSSYVSLNLNYISDAVFFGRKDSTAIPYLYTSAIYHHKSGIYGMGSLSYLTKSNDSRVDLFLVSLGYDFSYDNFTGDVSITKYFFNEASYNVISQVSADVTAVLSYDFQYFNLAATAANYFNNNSTSDFFLSTEISHDFITRNQKFQISPSVGFYFGSQNFYQEYYTNRGSSGQGQGQGQGGADNSTNGNNITVEESETFKIMAIEFGLPVWYELDPVIFMLYPIYVIPKSPSRLIVNEVVYEEDLNPTFYFTIGISLKI
ncbi:hypothetical protein [Winogradskyella aquimaris]|uniref:Outer membrane protein beta-barrel domain-containing protein n=1 Tax=Winogradskyella aquimaris TaxID=864074 RepID=A0ABU5EMU6_9FLAO|nr:hypothetical protein [Winogradskyella aquimaris]MDY2586850.1 hypothetical protein [Winogradskyella aquimaris]